MANRRPRRGPRDGRNVLISGDVRGDMGTRQPQGGARPVSEEYRESGDLEAREFGTPQADIPGGVRHLVNPETIPDKPPGVFERPADYHKYHGVESDDGQYYPPPGDVGKPRETAGVPKISDAVPVYEVEHPGKERRIRALITEGPVNIPQLSGAPDPVRLADRDSHRVRFWIVNEDTNAAHGVRIGDWETCADGRGLLIAGAQREHFVTQDAVYVIQTTSGTGVIISWGYETEVPAAGI